MTTRIHTNRRASLGLAAAVLGSLAVTSSASAGPRAYVASGAPSIGGCSKAIPCGQIGYAMGQVDSGGTVIVTDSDTYAPFIVTKEVTIKGAKGERPEIRGSNQAAITVHAPGEEVEIQNLDIRDRNRDSGVGIRLARGDLTVENVRISHASAGIYMDRYTETLAVIDSSVRRTGHGIYDGAFTGNLSVEDSRFANNLNGITVLGLGRTAIDRSRFVSNLFVAVKVYAEYAGWGGTITNSRFTHNSHAVTGKNVSVANSVFVGNSFAMCDATKDLGGNSVTLSRGGCANAAS